MWVFCCGMYRSASTLQFQITTRLVEDANLGQRVGWIDALRFDEVRHTHTPASALHVIKVHQFADPMGLEFQQGHAKGIYSFRDIRDVYASMMKQQQKPFNEIWNWQGRDFIQTCLDNYKVWTALPNVLISKYEDIIQNLPVEVSRIAAHLGISLGRATCERVASSFTIQRQQERIEKFTNKVLQMSIAANDHRALVDFHDETNLLHMHHIDSAKTGRWNDDLTAVEVSRIEEKVEQWCQENNYNPTIFLT